MRYAAGGVVRLGHHVQLGSDLRGVVVCSVDTDEYSEAYPKEDWSACLGKGVLIKTDTMGLVHLEDDDPDLSRESLTDRNEAEHSSPHP